MGYFKSLQTAGRSRSSSRSTGTTRATDVGQGRVEVEGLDQALKKMKMLDENIRKRIMRTAGKYAARPMLDSYRSEIYDMQQDEFNVYYKSGGIYATITPGQLRKSMGIMQFYSKARDMMITVVGPQVKRSFSDPEKGGWFAHFINYGYLLNGQYRGHNIGFADRARDRAQAATAAEFKQRFFEYASRYIQKISSK
jgi:hypothetical protein